MATNPLLPSTLPNVYVCKFFIYIFVFLFNPIKFFKISIFIIKKLKFKI
jgi:hypothetical protein